jgi:hypothetical protein
MISYINGDIFVFSPPKRSLKAWEPFWDCVTILFEFQNSDVDEEHTEWRLFWIAGIALLRTVGHVLAKADATTTNGHKQAIESAWIAATTCRSRESIRYRRPLVSAALSDEKRFAPPC